MWYLTELPMDVSCEFLCATHTTITHTCAYIIHMYIHTIYRYLSFYACSFYVFFYLHGITGLLEPHWTLWSHNMIGMVGNSHYHLVRVY